MDRSLVPFWNLPFYSRDGHCFVVCCEWLVSASQPQNPKHVMFSFKRMAMAPQYGLFMTIHFGGTESSRKMVLVWHTL